MLPQKEPSEAATRSTGGAGGELVPADLPVAGDRAVPWLAQRAGLSLASEFCHCQAELQVRMLIEASPLKEEHALLNEKGSWLVYPSPMSPTQALSGELGGTWPGQSHRRQAAPALPRHRKYPCTRSHFMACHTPMGHPRNLTR